MIDDDSAVADGGELATPANPRTPYSERPVARARRESAHELIERLLAEGRVRVTDPDDDEHGVAACRQLCETARPGTSGQAHREGSVRWAEAGAVSCGRPASQCAESTAEGEPDPVPVPSRLGNLHPTVSALRDDERRLAMPSGLRRRSILLLQGLPAEAVRRGYEMRKAHSLSQGMEP